MGYEVCFFIDMRYKPTFKSFENIYSFQNNVLNGPMRPWWEVLWRQTHVWCITFTNQVLQSRLYWFTHYNILSYGRLFGKTQWLVISLLLIEMSNEASMAPLTKHICKKAIRGADRLVNLIKEIVNCKRRDLTWYMSIPF